MNNADMPAMPTEKKVGDATYTSDGLTKREHFAAMAMQGLIHRASRGYSIADLAELSVVAADALLAELDRRGEA